MANIERLLQERLPTISQVDATPRPEPPTESVIEVDGYTGPHADSLAAKEAFEQVAGAEPVIASDQSLSSALSSLRGIIDRLKGDDQAHTSKESNATELPLPPWQAVQPLLNGTKGKPDYRRTIACVLLLTQIGRPLGTVSRDLLPMPGFGELPR